VQPVGVIAADKLDLAGTAASLGGNAEILRRTPMLA
jgi:hypothetical protein